MKKISIAILDITTFGRYGSSHCIHYYGKLYFSDNKGITPENAVYGMMSIKRDILNDDCDCETVEIEREITLKEAVELDKKDGGKSNVYFWKNGNKTTNRFRKKDLKLLLEKAEDAWIARDPQYPLVGVFQGEIIHTNKPT